MIKEIKKAIELMIYGLDLSSDEENFFKFIFGMLLLLIIFVITVVIW